MYERLASLRYASSSCLFSSVCYILTKPLGKQANASLSCELLLASYTSSLRPHTLVAQGLIQL